MKSHDGTTEPNDEQSLALIVSAKKSLREAQRARSWEQRVAAIARMNAANKIAKWVGCVPDGPSTDELMRLTRDKERNLECLIKQS